MPEKVITVENTDQLSLLFGNFDENIQILQNEFGVSVVCRGSDIKISGEEEAAVMTEKAVSALLSQIANGEPLTEQQVRYTAMMVKEGNEQHANTLSEHCLSITSRGKPVRPKTMGQKRYVDAINDHTITFGIGPAGTGKTYLAVAMAVKAFKAHEVSRIILTRPAVEAGEKLGFLPGDLQNKVDPYLRPLYDALFEMLGEEAFQRCLERGSIEVAPLAYMRGRTLDDSFIILDEAQNTTREQMKMFLTRLGTNSKSVITGDITQIDLPSSQRSGLLEASKILKGIDDIAIIRFSDKDVVRHKLVQMIVNAYESFYKKDGKSSHEQSKGYDKQ